jgi:4-amino-4-deoxy-L-arabinose transferase-like glycosyltransferase
MMIFPVKRFDVNMRSGIRVVSLVFLLAAMLFRFWHVRGPIDNFSAWRQTETAYMTWRMYQESPPEVMHSKVPYRGAKDVHLAEFPVQPLLMAYGYKLMGRESMVLARLFSLSFFCLGAYLLFLIVSRMLGRDIGWICLAIYSWLPLGIGYSRAVHVDFCVLFFCYAYLYFGMRFFDCRRWCFWMLSSFMATIAFAMKAPYCFFLGLPLLIYVFYIRERRSIYNLMLVCALFIIPLLAAIAYNAYRMALEASEQESLVYCMKWTPELSRNLFFGSFELRLDWERWKTVLRRTWWWVLTPGGGVLAVLGLAYRPRSQSWCGVLIAYGWYLGAVVYALTVFAIFSSTHDYYSLPLLAPAALAISFGI